MTWDGLLEDMTDTVAEFFGKPVLYTREGGETVEIVAVFDPEYVLQDAKGGVGASSTITVLDVRDRDIGGPPRSMDSVEIDGVRYEVSHPIPSTSGMTKAVLKRRR